MTQRTNRIGPELLAPAGDMERLTNAVKFGADAVYLAGKEYGMRASSPNFGPEELAKAVEYAHRNHVRVYLTCNNIMRNSDLPHLPDFLRSVRDAGVDAVIVADMGVLGLAKKLIPEVEIHISTQAGITNWAAAQNFYELGAKRVVLARELSLEDIAEIRAKTPKDLELEVFVHGAMCVSFSGRCLLSEFFTGRDANRGDCAQPCRWKYALMEEKRPGIYLPISEEDGGTYILNSRDLCLIEELPQLIRAGVTSLKIEGRAKSAYYAAVTTNAYRCALDWYTEHPDSALPTWIRDELDKISHRKYSTGFCLGGTPGQVYETGGYERGWEVIAVCTGMRDGYAVLSQRNRFFPGEVADVLEPGKEPYLLPMNEIYDEEGNPLTSANHAEMTVLVPTDREIGAGAILRKKIDG
jgi:putative protease